MSIAIMLLVTACNGGATPALPTTGATSTAAGAPPGTSGNDRTEDTQPLSFPQTTAIRFDHYSLEEGLSQSSPKCILQDDRGFLWAGTEDGLNRFDGYSFEVYRNNPDDPNSLSNNNINSLYQDESGMLWIGTYGGGLDRYDPETGQFRHYRHDPGDTNSLSDDYLLTVHGDGTGVLWIGTRQGGLNRFDPETESWRHYRNDLDDPRSLSNDTVRSILRDSVGVLWVGTASGLNRLDRESASGADEGDWRRYQGDPSDPHALSNGSITSLYEGRSGDLWVGTAGGGLNRFDPETETFVHYQHDSDDPHGLGDDQVWSVLEDTAGVLWVGTASGLDRLKREGSPGSDPARFAHYRNEPGDPHSLSDNDVRSLHQDRAGGLWIGTYGGGLDRYDGQREQFANHRSDPNEANSLSGSSVWSIYEDPSGVLWIGTDGGGLNRFDRETGEWHHYQNDPADPHSLSNNVVVSIYQDPSKIFWLGTWGGGLDRFDPETEQFAHYRSNPNDSRSLSSNVVWKIYEDSQGALWLGTASGLNRFDRETEQFTRYYHDPDDPQSLSDNNVGSIYEDRAGELWFGTHNGLNRFDRDTEQFTRYKNNPDDPQSLSHNIVFSIHEDPSGALWLGTWGGGLNRFDRQAETFAAYRVQDGLPNDVIYGILEDEASPSGEGGNLWLSTNYGLSRFDPHAETFRNYDAHDGLQSNEFNYNAYYKSRSGEMFFGGISGFNTFYPDRVRDNAYVPSMVLTSLTQRGEPAELDKTVEAVTEVTFKWPDNDFEFEFSALSYYQPEENQYAYMLEGFDEDWNYVGTRRFGGYTNLPGGTYTLRLKGSNNDGIWNDEGLAIGVTIVPPFWATWWFRGLAALLVVMAAIGGFRLRVRRIQKRSRELETQVASQTKELAALNAVAGVVSRTLDLQEIMCDALDKTLEVTELEAGGIYLLQEDASGRGKGVLKIAAHKGLSDQLVAGIDNLVVGEGFSGRVVETHEPMVVRDLPADPRLTRSVVAESGFHSVAIAPLVSRAKVVGTLFVMTRDPAKLSPQDVELLTAIGDQIGVATENARFFDAEQRRAEQFRVINKVDRHISSILDVGQLLQEIVAAIQDTFGYDIVGIGLIEDDEVVIRASAGVGGQDLGALPARIQVGKEGVMGWVASTGQPLLVPDVSKEPRYFRWPDTAKTRSELAVPLRTQSGIIGVLNVESDELNAFDNSDLMVLRALANQAAIAIENAHFFEAEQRRAEQFRIIAEVGHRISLTLDIGEVLVQVVRLIQDAFGYYHVGIGLIEADEVVYRVGAGTLWDDPDFKYKPSRLKVGAEGITGQVAASGEPLLVPDVSQDPRYVWMRGSQTRSELVVPIVVKGQVIGVLDTQSDRLNAFDDTDLAVLQSLAHLAGAAIENARLYEQAQQAAVMEERQRLARELHDAVTQTLFSASLIAEAVPASWEMDQQEGLQLLTELRQLTRGALAEMRTLLLELRPAALVETSLGDLLRQLAEATSGRIGVPVTAVVEGECALPADVHVALYRIAQEALNNVVKHARASQVEVTLHCSPPTRRGDRGGAVELRIHDDGRGFDPEDVSPEHLGLGIMRERAEAIGAQLEIESQPGHGTMTSAVWMEHERRRTKGG